MSSTTKKEQVIAYLDSKKECVEHDVFMSETGLEIARSHYAGICKEYFGEKKKPKKKQESKPKKKYKKPTVTEVIDGSWEARFYKWAFVGSEEGFTERLKREKGWT